MIDNKTQRLALPLPNVDNYLEDDVARLADALTILDEKVATVGSDGKIPVEQIPAVALTDTFPVSSEAAMLSLDAQPGDVAIREDLSKSFILMSAPATMLGNWKEIVNDALVQLGKTSGGSLVVLLDGKTVQQVADRLTANLLAEDATLSTESLAGKTKIEIDRAMTVVDSDNQGAKVGAGATIVGNMPNQNPITTTKKAQSALRLDGDDISINNVTGGGVADSTNTSTSEFITSRMADAVDGKKLKRLRVRGADITGFTTGIALSGINGAIIQDVRARNMRYSPTGLNSAGGYLMVCGGNAKHVIMNAIQHQLVPGADRHTLYISANSGDTLGWSYWNVSNVDSDYSANSVDNKGVSGVPFAMSPIHVRNGQNLNLVNHMVEGYICSAFDYENQFGPINNTNVSNVMATESQSFQNGTLTEQGVLRVGYNQYPHTNEHHNFSNFNIKMVRGTDNAGNKMAAGTDNGVHGSKVQFANFSNGQITVESGCAFRLYNSSYINIDNICDRLLDTTSGLNSIYLKACSNITIGNVQSNRQPTGSKERIYTIEDDCTEITCRFPRRVSFIVNSSGISSIEDRWNMLNGTPTLNADGKTVNVPLRTHVSTNAKRLCNVHNLTLANVKAVRVGDIDANTLRVGFWDTSLNAQSTTGNANNVVVIEFTC